MLPISMDRDYGYRPGQARPGQARGHVADERGSDITACLGKQPSNQVSQYSVIRGLSM